MRAMTVIAAMAAATCLLACGKKEEPAVDPAAATLEAAKDPAAAEPAAAEPVAAAADPAAADAAPAAADPAAGAAADPAADANDPMKRAIDLQRKALEILKANKDDAAKAAKALDAFHAENKASIEALKKDLEAMAKTMKENPQAALAFMNKYSGEIESLTKLTMELANDAPALMNSPEVAAAMAKLAPDAADDEPAVEEAPVAPAPAPAPAP